jgi:RNA polymerase sigma factor (sigma-70 family)
LKKKRLYSRKRRNYSDEELVLGIKEKNNEVLSYLYLEYYDKLSEYIVKGENLNEEDAKDIFQDTMIIVWENILNNKVNLKNKFITYFFGISRILLMERLKLEYKINKDRSKETDPDQVSIEPEEIISPLYPITEIEIQSDKEIIFQLFSKHFYNLKEDCKNVIKMFYAGIPYEEIARRMGYKNETYAKNKKRRCKDYLQDSIFNDRLYKLMIK